MPFGNVLWGLSQYSLPNLVLCQHWRNPPPHTHTSNEKTYCLLLKHHTALDDRRVLVYKTKFSEETIKVFGKLLQTIKSQTKLKLQISGVKFDGLVDIGADGTTL